MNGASGSALNINPRPVPTRQGGVVGKANVSAASVSAE